MYITELRQAKKDKNRVHIYSQDKYVGTVYIDFVLKHKIKIDTDVDTEVVNEAIQESNNQKLFYLCINYIMRRLRSEREIINYITNKIFKYKWDKFKVNTEEIIEKLKKYKYLDDEEFSKSYSRTQLGKGHGPNRIKMELAQKGIEKMMAQEAIDELDPEEIEMQRNKTETKYLKNKKFKNESEKNWKLKQYLMSRGFFND